MSNSGMNYEEIIGATGVTKAEKGAGEGVATLTKGKELTASQVPASVVSSSQVWVNVKDHGGTSTPAETTATIQAAQEAALALSANAGLIFPAGTYEYNATLKMAIPWVGAYPRKVILKQVTEGFTYKGFASQFSMLNQNFSSTYNAGTADTIHLENIDFVIASGEVVNKGGVGFANVAGGEIKNCQFSTTGTGTIDALADVYASVRGLKLDGVIGINSTQAEHGGCLWIRNQQTNEGGAVAGNITERIRVTDTCVFATTTGDEAVSVFGAGGKVRDVRIKGTVEGLSSSRPHAFLATTFPLSNSGALTHSAVEDVVWECTFNDLNETITGVGSVLRFGASGDEANICQNIRHINCTFNVKIGVAENTASVCTNIKNAFTGSSAETEAINPKIHTSGSTVEWLNGINGFERVVNPTITGGKVLQAINSCNNVVGPGKIEAIGKLFVNCPSVVGVVGKFNGQSGTVNYVTGTANTSITCRGCNITGGKSLLVATGTTSSAVHIDIQANTHNTTAESGNVIEVPSEGSVPRVRILGNTLLGEHELARAGTIAESSNNDWYGTIEPPFSAARLLLPSSVATYKEPGANTTENRACLAESFDRIVAGNTVTLASGTPVFAAIAVRAGVPIRGVCFEVQATEGTAANRTHLCCALLNTAGEKLKVSADYTSSVNTELAAGHVYALLFSSLYEPTVDGVLIALLWETMSSTSPITIVQREGNVVLNSATPPRGGTGTVGQTTPGSLPSTVTLTGKGQVPWLGFV